MSKNGVVILCQVLNISTHRGCVKKKCVCCGVLTHSSSMSITPFPLERCIFFVYILPFGNGKSADWLLQQVKWWWTIHTNMIDIVGLLSSVCNLKGDLQLVDLHLPVDLLRGLYLLRLCHLLHLF